MMLARLFLPAAIGLAGCAGSYPQIIDAPTGSEPSTVSIYLVANAEHTGIVVPLEGIPAEVWPESRDFPGVAYLEVGWGDRGYYFERDQGFSGTAAAAFWPTPSVIHVTGVPTAPARYFWDSEVIELTISRQGFERLIRYFADAFDRSGAAVDGPLAPGLYGDSRFYPGWESFHLFRTCNIWTARALRTAGLSVHGSITNEELVSQAREIGTVVNQP